LCGTQPPRFFLPARRLFFFRAGSFLGEILAELQANLSRCEEWFEYSRLAFGALHKAHQATFLPRLTGFLREAGVSFPLTG
jgi:hypothetical protein